MIARTGKFGVLVLLWLAVSNCQTSPRNAFGAGQQALAGGDLVAALRSFDAVPVSHPDYPQARLRAAALECRLQRHKEKLLRGLQMRSQWRDEQALAAFSSALAEWPEHAETRELIATTRNRLDLLERTGSSREVVWMDPPERDPTDVRSGLLSARSVGSGQDLTAPVVSRAAVVEEDSVPSLSVQRPAVPVAESVALEESVDETASANAGDAVAGSAAGATPRERAVRGDQVAEALAQIAAGSAAGRIDDVLHALQALQRTWPNDRRVTSRLARLLHQRGLMSYGNGDLAAAVADWRRALQLDPSLRTVRALFDVAAAELASETGASGSQARQLPETVAPSPGNRR